MKNNRLKLILWIITAVVLLYGIIFPNVRLIFSSSPTKFVEILAQTSTLESILASLLVSMLSVLLSALIGVPLAFLFDRYEFPFRKIFAALVALPLALPPLVGADFARLDSRFAFSRLHDVSFFLSLNIGGTAKD
jgi:iron(III) transport system permease protein